MKAPLLFIFIFVSTIFSYSQSPCNCTLTQGDFSAALPFMSTNSSAVNFYAYGNPIGASANTGLELSETLLVMLHEDTNTGNTSLIIILDQGNDGTGGDVDLTVNCLPDSAAVAVADDAGELFGAPPTITGDFSWVGCCTDGGVISGVGCGNTITINPTINSGINFFSLVYGTQGSPTYINMPDIQCPITINCGGVACCDDAFDFSGVTQDPNCEDSFDGSIDLTTDCATIPSFQWSNNATTEDISGLAPGTYFVTITDINNCSETASYTLTAGSSPQPAITGPTEFCDGDVVILGVDGVYPNYLWSTSSMSSSISVNLPDTYSVTVTDGSGCTGTASITLTQNPEPVVDDYGEYCEGAAFYYPPNGQTYLLGDHYILYPGGSSHGCDSTVILHVQEHPNEEIDIIRTICEGEEVIINNVPYTQQGFYQIDLQTSFGCDSIVYLDLTVLNPMADIVPPESLGCNVTQVLVNGALSMGDIYEWSTDVGFICAGDGTPVITACSPGNYCLTVTSFGIDEGQFIECSEEMCVEVIEDNNTPILFISNSEDESCEGASDGSATVEVSSGGVAPFIITWNSSPIQIGETAINLPCGQVCATVTGNNGCFETICVTINCPEEIVVSTSSNDILCFGQNDGSATAIAGGGAGGFTYEWDTDPITEGPNASGLAAGIYTVVVTDANDCTDEAMVEIMEPDAMGSVTSFEDANCNGEASGSASIEVSGGMGMITYSWDTNPVQDSSIAVNLTAGDYTVIVTDGNGCTISESYTISEPSALVLTESTTLTSCNNTPDGSATVNPSGGVGPYQYLWDANAIDQETQTAVDLTSGNYTVTVTDANGCTAEITAEVTSPNGMVVDPSSVDASCNGGDDGSATVPTSGGTAPYEWIWNDGQDTETAANLTAGTYDVTIMDANGCEEYQTFIIAEPDAITIASTTEDALCNQDDNGSATVTPSGGTPGPGYSYEWDTNPVQNGATANNLTAGTYTVIVTDDNGCTESETVQINEPAVLSLAITGADALCNQVADGTATVTPSGGTTPYTYDWGNGQLTAMAIDLLAGDYTVVVEDANGCTEQASITIDEPAALSLATEGTDPDCYDSQDGTATVTPDGGTTPYSYDWGNGQLTATATGLDGGIYTVIVTDANGCTESQNVNLVAPTEIVLTIDSENILCFDESTGSATVSPSGGTSPYTYEWNDGATQNTSTAVNLPAGSYIVTVTDDNDCTAEIGVDLTEPASALGATGTSTDALCGVDNGTIDLTTTGGTGPYDYLWEPGSYTDEDPQNLGPGTYTVVITDANDCTFTTSVQVSTPSGLEALVSVTDVVCNGESNGGVDITVNGGVVPYTYAWSDPTYDGQQDLIDVPANSYTLTLTDADGCTVIASAIVAEPDALQATATPSQASCGGSDGSISLVVSGGTGAGTYTFDWENDGTGDTYNDQSPNGLPQGDYTGVITDGNGCSLTVTAAVTVPDGPVASISAIDLSCFENNTGSIELDIVGGEMPYDFEWNDATYNGQEDLSDIPAGTYTVLITDDNSCSTTASIEVMEPELLEVSAAMTPVICFGQNDGTMTAVATGGTGISTFSWDTPDPDAAQAGIYTVIATDENGCTAETTIEVTEPAELQASASAVDVDCNGASTGSLSSQVNGGTPPYTYAWTGGYVDQNPSDVPANSYTVMITDDNGCTTTAQAVVAEPEALSASSVPVESTCGEANGSIDLTVEGGVEPYAYLWSNGDQNQDPGALVPGPYIVTITDANGCTYEYGDVVTTPSALTISGSGTDVDCYGASTGSTDITVGGGSQPFTYLWNDGQTTEDAVDLTAGTYTVIVTDANDCTISTQIAIAEPPPFEATQLVATGVSCNGGEDGSIVITVTGGTAPYVSYIWDNTPQMVPDPSNLSAGSYALTVTDSQGCTAVSEAITIEEPDAILLTTTSVSALCNGSSDGSINLEVSNGTAPYTYSWNNGAYVVEDPSDIPAGQYSVVVTDANGCTETTTETVDQPQALQIAIDNVSNYGGYNVTCWNTEDGEAEAFASGGTAPFSYLWSNGAGTAAVENLAAGDYSVVVTDDGGCTNTAQLSLTAPEAIVASASAVATDCYGESDGQVIIAPVSGGAPPYMYSIGGAFSSVNQFVNLPAGDYDAIVEDVNGCEWTSLNPVTVVEPPEFTVEIIADAVDNTIDMGDSTVLRPQLNIPLQQMDTFVWKEREITDFEPWVMPWQTQSYSIVVTTVDGCKAENMILIRVNKDRLVYVPNTFSPNNDGFNDIFNIFTGRGVESVNNFRIFSRWGEMVYEKTNVAVGGNISDPENGWDGMLDGEPMNPGVFVYVFEVTFIDGRVETYKGDVTLVK